MSKNKKYIPMYGVKELKFLNISHNVQWTLSTLGRETGDT
jgi:hypothetical protein